jgi:FixJ family two-component response regulator
MPRQNQRIVVVDDDPAMNQAIGRLLRAAGYNPVTFPSAEALVEAGAAQTAACLVFDVHLPGASGFELLRKLAASFKLAPVIFITAFDEIEARSEAAEAGAAAYFAKPFSGRKLISAIESAIEANVRSRVGAIEEPASGTGGSNQGKAS